MKRNMNQSGFTILELMIATVIFAILLLGATTMIVQIGRMYYKGVVNSRTQQTARTIADDIGRVLQFESAGVTEGSVKNVSFPDGTVSINAFCIGSVQYSYIIDAQVNADVAGFEQGNRQNYVPHALWRETDPPADCEPVDLFNIPADSDGQEMLGDGMRLISFGAPVTSNRNVSSFTVGVMYGDDDELIDFNNSDLAESKCRGSGLGAQWCSRSLLEISVYRRLQ